MDERLNNGQELPHSRIFEAVFPWKFNSDRRLKRMREYFDILFDSHKIIEEPQEIEKDVYWTTVSFNQENDLSIGHRRGRVNVIQRLHKIKMLGITIEESEQRKLRRAS